MLFCVLNGVFTLHYNVLESDQKVDNHEVLQFKMKSGWWAFVQDNLIRNLTNG